MSVMDPHRVQVLRQQIGRVLRGKSIHDGTGALECVIVDVLLGLPYMSEVDAIGAFAAKASDVRNIIRERFATRDRPNRWRPCLRRSGRA